MKTILALLTITLLVCQFGSALSRRADEEMETFMEKARGMKCQICKDVVDKSVVWTEKVDASYITQLKHCHDLFRAQKGSPEFQAAMFACHDITREEGIGEILNSVKNSADADHCASYCNAKPEA
ncbi:hypothetical protein Ddc_09068 [Ditylenchus destructor]|nr:hypothetical protein Ddc_09068 [Ditylenchus destructor]